MPSTDVHPIDGRSITVITANTVVVGTGSAGYCAADRLWEFGQSDIVMVTDNTHRGTSRNAGSDKQTYYKLTLSGSDPDSVVEMARTLFAGGAMDGDVALAEAALSARCFLRLCDLGVPFPQNRYGEFIGYKTDHDPRRRATSVGPYTSRTMVECLEKKVRANGTRVIDKSRVVDIIVENGRVAGMLLLRTDLPLSGADSLFYLVRCSNIVYASGGPAGIYANRVFPHGQWGASGAALRAGVRGKNLTEWQFGLASVAPRWNVSGTYMQAIPRFISTARDGSDEREFLSDAITDYGRLLTLTFLKGYQWPFDVRKAQSGSSIIDLLVYQETVIRGRRVFMDFRSNPVRARLDVESLEPEAYDYLERAGALFGTPIERLKHMNMPSYRFYLERNPGIDLAETPLEIDLCAQHNNGGLSVDAWWQSNITGFFPVGEAGGAHGVYRPGGAALNSGQVGATRAAQYIAVKRDEAPLGMEDFISLAAPRLGSAIGLIDQAVARCDDGHDDNTGTMLTRLQHVMSRDAGPVRSSESIHAALADVQTWLREFPDQVTANPNSRRSVDRVFLLYDMLTTAFVYLAAMADYVSHGGRSRGSVLYSDPDGALPSLAPGDGARPAAGLPEIFRFQLDHGSLDGEIQETEFGNTHHPTSAGIATFTWRPVHAIPADDDFFENVWKEFREHKNVL